MKSYGAFRTLMQNNPLIGNVAFLMRHCLLPTLYQHYPAVDSKKERNTPFFLADIAIFSVLLAEIGGALFQEGGEAFLGVCGAEALAEELLFEELGFLVGQDGTADSGLLAHA